MQVTHRKNDGIDIRGLEEDNHANDEDNYDLKVNFNIHLTCFVTIYISLLQKQS